MAADGFLKRNHSSDARGNPINDVVTFSFIVFLGSL